MPGAAEQPSNSPYPPPQGPQNEEDGGVPDNVYGPAPHLGAASPSQDPDYGPLPEGYPNDGYPQEPLQNEPAKPYRRGCTHYAFHPDGWHHLGDVAIVIACALLCVSTTSCYVFGPKYLVRIDSINLSIRPLDKIHKGNGEPRKIQIARGFHNAALVFTSINVVLLLLVHNLFMLNNRQHYERTCLGYKSLHARNLLKWIAFIACLCAFAAGGMLIDESRMDSKHDLHSNYIAWGTTIGAGLLSYAVFQIYLFADRGLCGVRISSKDVERQATPITVQDELLQAPDDREQAYDRDYKP